MLKPFAEALHIEESKIVNHFNYNSFDEVGCKIMIEKALDALSIYENMDIYRDSYPPLMLTIIKQRLDT